MDAGFRTMAKGASKIAQDTEGFGSLFADVADIMEGRVGATKSRGKIKRTDLARPERRTDMVNEMIKNIEGWELLPGERRKQIQDRLRAQTQGDPSKRVMARRAAQEMKKFPEVEVTGTRGGFSARVKVELVDQSGNIIDKTETSPGQSTPGK
jgi:hypothetical protein